MNHLIATLLYVVAVVIAVTIHYFSLYNRLALQTHVTGVANWIGNCPRQESDENSVAPHDSLKTTAVVPLLAS